MRIVVSTPTFLPIVGGAELGIHEIYNRLGRKHDVTILTPCLPQVLLDGYGAHDYASDHYRVHHIFPSLEHRLPYIARRALKRTSFMYTAELALMMRNGRPDVINFHFVRPHGGALLAMDRLYGVPTVLSLVGRSDVVELLSPAERWYAENVIRRADAVLPNSTYYLGSHRTDPHVTIIPYGVDTDAFSASGGDSMRIRRQLGLTDENFVLFSIQRLAPIKRVDALIRMMAEVVPRDPRVVLIIGGQGEEDHELRRLTTELHLQENVRFAGYIDSEQLPEYFASSNAFVFHSMLETFGIVFAQAMAAGLPIVAANTSCVPDVLTSENGFLVEPFDTDAFAEAVLTLAGDRKLARKIGERNRAQAIREFDWDLIADQYEQVLLDTVAQRRAGQAGRHG
jgi:phosphatidylinositol alpha-1,6-mannosyltransferase